MDSAYERIDINELWKEYHQHILSPNTRHENKNQPRITNNVNGCITTCCANLKRIIMDKPLWWFKCHKSGKILGSTLQLLVIGDLVSDLYFLSRVIEYKEGWWIFFSILILYLSLRFTLVFTATFEKDFFGVKKSNGMMGKSLEYIWDVFRKIATFYWEADGPKPSLAILMSLFIPGAWQFVYFLGDIIQVSATFCEIIFFIFVIMPIFVLYTFVIEVIVVPIFVILFSPIVLVGHVVKGIYGVWKTNSISFFENSFKIQTIIFYSTIASLFETVTESLPQFLLQSWIYIHSKNFIPDTTYYISVGFSLLNILKAICIFITTRKELKFSTIRLADNISKEDDICEWNEGILALKLNGKKENCVIQMIQHFSNSAIQHLDVSRAPAIWEKKIVKRLRELNSQGVRRPKFSDNGVRYIAENCHQLKTLNLSCTSVTDEGLKAIAEKCLKLESLDLIGTEIIDSSVSYLLFNCKQLHTLDLPLETISHDEIGKYRREHQKIEINTHYCNDMEIW